jgi:antitoxin component YwqK of YwqJK toxin-antitoxin module
MWLRKFLIVILVFATTSLLGQDLIVKKDSLNYKNKFFFNGLEGDLTLIYQDSLTSVGIVHWKNKYHLIGNFKNGKEDGYWLLFDKCGVLRKKIVFLNGEIGMVTVYDKKGRSTPAPLDL